MPRTAIGSLRESHGGVAGPRHHEDTVTLVSKLQSLFTNAFAAAVSNVRFSFVTVSNRPAEMGGGGRKAAADREETSALPHTHDNLAL